MFTRKPAPSWRNLKPPVRLVRDDDWKRAKRRERWDAFKGLMVPVSLGFVGAVLAVLVMLAIATVVP